MREIIDEKIIDEAVVDGREYELIMEIEPIDWFKSKYYFSIRKNGTTIKCFDSYEAESVEEAKVKFEYFIEELEEELEDEE